MRNVILIICILCEDLGIESQSLTFVRRPLISETWHLKHLCYRWRRNRGHVSTNSSYIEDSLGHKSSEKIFYGVNIAINCLLSLPSNSYVLWLIVSGAGGTMALEVLHSQPGCVGDPLLPVLHVLLHQPAKPISHIQVFTDIWLRPHECFSSPVPVLHMPRTLPGSGPPCGLPQVQTPWGTRHGCSQHIWICMSENLHPSLHCECVSWPYLENQTPVWLQLAHSGAFIFLLSKTLV